MKIASLVLLAIAVVSADELRPPLGKGLEELDFHKVDSFVLSIRHEQSYAENGWTGGVAREVFAQMFPEDAFELDTNRQILTLLGGGFLATNDSAGLQRELRMVVQIGGQPFDQYIRRIHDSLGRPKAELDLELDPDSPGSEPQGDTILWLWENPGCAHDLVGDTARAWSVDAQGRCDTAPVLFMRGGLPEITGMVDRVVWNGELPSGFVRTSGTDTLGRVEYQFDDRGRLRQKSEFVRDGGRLQLLGMETYRYAESGLQSFSFEVHDGPGVVAYWEFQSTRLQVGVAPRQERASNRVSVRRDGGVLVFSNSGATRCAVELFDPVGNRLGSVLVPAGGEAGWKAGAGAILWKSSAPNGAAESGILLP